MKIQIASDLHITNWIQVGGPIWWQDVFLKNFRTDADVLILAGDIVSTAFRERLWSQARLLEFGALYKHVVLVPGNHEFWDCSIYDGLEVLRNWEKTTPSLQVLEPGKVVEIDGKRFHGGVMFQPHRGSLWAASRKRFVDGRMISDFYTQAPAQFDLLMQHLQKECRPGDIVVTHHAPSMQSVDLPWVGHADNRFYITPEAEDVMKQVKPALWIHGHVHSHWDYVIGSTRVIANPMGYPGEGVKFDMNFVVSV